MGLTVTLSTPSAERVKRGSNQGGVAILTGSVAFDSSYPTGGEDASGISGKFKSLEALIFECAAGYSFEYDATNDLVKAYWVDTTVDGAPQAEVTNTTDLSGITAAKFIAVGVMA